MDLPGLKDVITALVREKRGDITAIVEQLYHRPETALQEEETSTLLADTLEQAGFKVERGIASLPTAFRAIHGTGTPAIAIIAEMDALPELGHACGHNIVAAAAVGAALALRYALPPERATVIVLGTPAEETGVGKIELIKSGFFDEVHFAMMVHPSSKRQVLKSSLGLAKIRFTFLGKAAHAAAYPEEGINALDGVIQTFNGINALRQQLRDDVRVHGVITEGGIVPNIIPERASCFFYVRGEDLAEVINAKERVVACARGAALASGCDIEVEENERVLAPLRLNRTFSRVYSDQLAFLGLVEASAPLGKNRGSSDIGNVSQIVPVIHPHVPIGEGIRIHTADFARATISEQGKAATIEGATALALTAAELAFSPALRTQILDEFRNGKE